MFRTKVRSSESLSVVPTRQLEISHPVTMTDRSPSMDPGGPAYRWFGLVSGAIAKIVIPLVVAYVGWAYSSAIKEQEFGATYVQLSLKILEQAPDERPAGLATWAMDVVDHYSGVKLDSRARKELAETPLFLRERAIIVVTPTEKGEFALEQIGSAVLEISSVEADAVSGLQIVTTPGLAARWGHVPVHATLPVRWSNGRMAFVRLRGTDAETGKARFSVLVAKRRPPTGQP